MKDQLKEIEKQLCSVMKAPDYPSSMHIIAVKWCGQQTKKHHAKVD